MNPDRDFEKNVVLLKSDIFDYPESPFSPPDIYPEFIDINLIDKVDNRNKIYKMIREIFIKLDLDRENIGTRKWNPLSELIKKGDNVVIKPNLVYHAHPLGKMGVLSMITHASVIRPIIDYVLLATNKDCMITICDVPLQEADFEIIIKNNGLKNLIEYYYNNGVNISLLDLRLEISHTDDEGVIIKRDRKQRDPFGYVAVDLKEKSAFVGIIEHYKKLEITNYSSGTVTKHHNPEKNEYLISKTILNADVFINVPKLKTHRKAGMTAAMKNLVGINGDKSWIAHHRCGPKDKGGDEYEEFDFFSYSIWHLNSFLKNCWITRPIARYFRKTYRVILFKGKTIKQISLNPSKKAIMAGSWHGNDTIWRSILDLNNILFFADKDGKMHDNLQRRYIAIVDSILAGEKEGPMEQLPKKVGVLIGGFNPVAVDYITSHIMGFDYRKIPMIREGFKNENFDLCPFTEKEIDVHSNVEWEKINLIFEPTIGWKGHIERWER